MGRRLSRRRTIARMVGLMANILTELLEKDKEKLILRLTEAGTPERAVPVLESETDRLLAFASEELGSERERQAAGGLLRAVRMTVHLTDSAGEVREWTLRESSGSSAGNGGKWAKGGRDGARGRRDVLKTALLLAGAALLIAGFLAAAAGGIPILGAAVTPILFVLSALSAVCFFFSGFLMGKGKKEEKEERTMTEVRVDPDKVYRSFHASMLVADEALRELSAAALLDRRKEKENASKDISPEELDLFSSLLEAAISDDPVLMKERMEDVRYYLHQKGIEVLDYSEENRNLFDVLPSKRKGTLRPALKSGDMILRRGTAGL